jgi:hypothetical protein
MVTGRPNDVLKGLHVIEKIFKSDIIDLFAIEMGIESNSQRALDLLSRGLTPEINRKAMDALVNLKTRYSPETVINANIILFPHWDMGIDDFVENIRFIGDYQCSRETMSLRLYGVAGTPLWEDMIANGFETNKGLGQRITEYPFTDDAVERLFQKLIRDPLKRTKIFTPGQYYAFQYQIHDTVLDFYRSDNIKQSVMEFISA